MPRLTVRRTSEWNNKLRAFKILLNDEEVRLIEDGKTEEIELESGTHELVVKIDWCSSQTVNIAVTGNENVTFEVAGFKYAGWIAPIATGTFVIYYFLTKFTESSWDWMLVIPIVAILYPIYYITIGKKKYLRLRKL
tara:strand:+ start:39829 stop:40239 length:411 start_codon:yes stop_codon:yes gene_type:complete